MTSRFVYIARHAWASEFGDPRWSDDSLRELEADGAERYVKVVEALAERGFAPELVATSPYARMGCGSDARAAIVSASAKTSSYCLVLKSTSINSWWINTFAG